MFTLDAGEVQQDDPDDPMRTALRQMMGVFAQLERGMVTDRLRRGKAAKRAQGGYVGGRVSYGKRPAGDGAVVVDEAEARLVEQVCRHLWLAGATGTSARRWTRLDSGPEPVGPGSLPSCVASLFGMDARDNHLDRHVNGLCAGHPNPP